MKRIFPFLFMVASLASASGEFKTWTSKDGRSTELELVNVIEKDGEKAGEFRARNGRTFVLKASELDGESAAALSEADMKSEAPAESVETVFDELLDGKLVKLEGRSVRRFDPESKPAKFYVFYYSASWCPPCQRYTPELVNFYNKLKPDNANFEIVFISSDRDDGSMSDYMKDKKMPWPALKVRDSQKFKKEIPHGVKGIPSVIVCTLDGTIVARTRSLPELEKILTAE